MFLYVRSLSTHTNEQSNFFVFVFHFFASFLCSCWPMEITHFKLMDNFDCSSYWCHHLYVYDRTVGKYVYIRVQCKYLAKQKNLSTFKIPNSNKFFYGFFLAPLFFFFSCFVCLIQNYFRYQRNTFINIFFAKFEITCRSTLNPK